MYSEKCYKCYNGVNFENVERGIVCTKMSAVMQYIEYMNLSQTSLLELEAFVCKHFIARENI
jgi:hypothetical protein